MKRSDPERMAVVLRMRAEGCTHRQIADHLGVKPSRVQQALRLGRWPIRQRYEPRPSTGRPQKGSRVQEPGYLESQYRSNLAFKKALKSGTIESQPCSICGSIKNVDAHHEDYSKPLEVVWLCRSHHQLRHVQLRRERLRAA